MAKFMDEDERPLKEHYQQCDGSVCNQIWAAASESGDKVKERGA